MPADDLLRRLAARPALLWALAVLGNAVWMPHTGVSSDAILYAAQVLNAHDGRLANDLFFAYGSQSKYTAFPQFFAVLSAAVGLETAFLLGYLAASAGFAAGLVALFRRLLGPTALLPLAVLWCACGAIPCGDADEIRVNESFLTARPLAGALGLFALDCVVAGRWRGFAALTAAALAVHPLVAAPVALTGLACAVARSGRWGWPLVGVATVAGLSLLAVPGFAVAAFGPMGAAWRGQILAVMPYPDPTIWAPRDGLRLGLAAAAALAFARLARGAPAATLAATAVLVAAVGALLAGYAARDEARLLFQGQAYRWVWPLEVLRAPLTLAVAAWLWPRAGRGGRVGLVALGLVVGSGLLECPGAWRPGVAPLGRVACVLAAAYLARRPLAARGAAPALLVAAVAWQVAAGGATPEGGPGGAADRALVADYLRDRELGGPRVTVYMAGVDQKWVWCDLDCDSYFMPGQASGITFSEAGAAETFRRGRLARPFEWDGGPAPTQADFDALAAEPGVDLLVLRQEFPGSAATNGRVFVYDLRRVRGR